MWASGTKLYVRVGGSGRAVALLHGYGETGDMWVPLANLARDHTVVVPDLRGMGLSAKPTSGYDKKRKPTTSQASSMRSRSSAQHSSPTTSGTWSATPSPRSTVSRGHRPAPWLATELDDEASSGIR